MNQSEKEAIKKRILERRAASRARSIKSSVGTAAIKDQLLNLHKINDSLDQIMADLSLESEPDNDIGTAIAYLRAASELLVKHGQKLVNTPVKTGQKGQYDNFEEGGAGFDSASELFKQQMQDRRDASDEEDNARIEAQTDADYHARTGDTIERDANGQFASFLKGNAVNKQQVALETERGYNLGKRTIWSKRG